MGLAGCDLGIGIGIHARELSFGECGWSHCDLTAIGTVINTAFLVGADQILLTREVNQYAQPKFSRSEAEVYQLKGFQNRSSSARLDRFCRSSNTCPAVSLFAGTTG